MAHKVSISTDEIRDIARRQKAAKAARANALIAKATR